ncbi:MAG: hypothetical protein ACK2T6_06140 [Anaerolineae bacterium]
MARVHAGQATVGPMLYGAVGGVAAGLFGLVVMTAAEVLGGGGGFQTSNLIGAWFVRWLQVADTDALTGFYADATLGGMAVAAVGGAVVGALVAGLLARHPEARMMAWGVVSGLLAWAIVWYLVAPVLSPVLVRVLDWRVAAASGMAYGLMLGWWMRFGRFSARSIDARLTRP